MIWIKTVSSKTEKRRHLIFYVYFKFSVLNVPSKNMHRSNSELDLQRYHDMSPLSQEKIDDKKKRGRSPFRYLLYAQNRVLLTVLFKLISFCI